jgi:hypothetical protein
MAKAKVNATPKARLSSGPGARHVEPLRTMGMNVGFPDAGSEGGSPRDVLMTAKRGRKRGAVGSAAESVIEISE